MVYECDVRFEHCYALDQGAVPADAKKECWRDWLHAYTYGQSRDRVEFAATRFSELSLDATLPNEDVRSSRPRRPDRPVAAPVPTNAFAPPPNVSEGHIAPEPSTATSRTTGTTNQDPPPLDAASARPPGADCARTCDEKWDRCHSSCKDQGCDACDRTYRVCIPACFHEEGSRGPPVKSTR
jgi:hypothetical protein